MSENLVVGAGISGASVAYLLAEKLNEKVLVIDRRPHIAGNCFDYKDKNNITIQKYGSHIFHTSEEKVWKFLNQFSVFNNYEHKVFARFDNKLTNIPFNLNSLYNVFSDTDAKNFEEKLLNYFEQDSKISILELKNIGDKDLKQLADFIYEKIFLHYSQKQWGIELQELDNSVVQRVPVYISKDNRYFQDKYQGIPIDGYTKLIEKMLTHKNIKIILNTDFKTLNPNNYKRIFYTGSIDEFFDYKFGKLPYRSVFFELEEHNKEFYQTNSVINYTCSEEYTRIHEYKYYLNENSKKTIIAKEYSTDFKPGENERFYPIPNEKNRCLYGKYIKEAESLKNTYFVGRLGKYKYYNMDTAVLDAIELFESRILKEKE